MSKLSRYYRLVPIVVLGLILLLGLGLRLFHTDVLPISMNNDEIDFIVQAKSVFYTFTDLDRTWNPLSLQPLAKEAKSEILYLLLAPIFGPVALSLFTVRLPYIIANLLIISLLFLFTKLFLSQATALSVAAVATINPWMLFLSRTAFESHLAILFYLAGVVLLFSKSTYIKMLSVFFFFLGFYSYMGTKVLLVPIVLSTCILAWKTEKKTHTILYSGVAALSLVLFLSFCFTLISGSSQKRVNEFSFNDATITQAVDVERKSAIPSPLQRVITNKVVLGSREALERFFGAFSFDMLFTQGDPHSLYGFWDHGLFYYTDCIFLILGFIALYKRKRLLFWYVLVMVLLGALPSALSHVDTSYVHRSSWMLLILLIPLGVGLQVVLETIHKRKFATALYALLGVVLLLQLGNFYTLYLYRNPIYNPIQGAFENRIIAKYISEELTQHKKVAVIADNRHALFKSYLFYTDSMNSETIVPIQKAFAMDTPRFGTLTYDNTCPKQIQSDTTYIIFDLKCSTDFPDTPYSMIPILKDGNPIYKIYNDRLCAPYTLSTYPSNFQLSHFAVEKLDIPTFCTTFITKRI